MKLQVKFDKKAIQDLLLRNVEKIVLGVVVLVFLLMLYSALTTAGRFGKSPEDLQRQTADGRRQLDATPPKTDLVVPDYVSQAKQSRVLIEEQPYLSVTLWDPPLFPKPSLRDTPPLLVVEQLHGTAEVGAFQVNPAVATETRTNALDAPPARDDRRTAAAAPNERRTAAATRGDRRTNTTRGERGLGDTPERGEFGLLGDPAMGARRR